MNDQLWDVFISHASEDKESVARPLAAALKKGGVRAWIDEHELKLGDSLSGKIDKGLAQSRFGVVILSKHFFAKRWPQSELAGLRALEIERKVILPVWHEIDKATVAKNSPVLADLLAVSTSSGIETVARSILDVIFSRDSLSPSLINPTVSRRFIELLNSNPTKLQLISFLQSHAGIVAHLMRSGTDPLWEANIAGVDFDAVTLANVGTTSVPTLHCVSFLPIWGNPFDELNLTESLNAVAPKSLLKNAMRDAERVIEKYHENNPADPIDVVRKGAPDQFNELIRRVSERAKEEVDLSGWPPLPLLGWAPLIEITFFCGSRKYVDATQTTARAWRDWRAANGHLRLRTYDGLLEAIQQAEDHFVLYPRIGHPFPWNF